jgi:hypothetical protein
MAHCCLPISQGFRHGQPGILCASVWGMESQWKLFGRPALVGFVVGLFVMTGLAYVAPLAGLGARPSTAIR